MSKQEKVTLLSSQVYLAENQENPNSHFAKFVICDFGRNKNGVSINKETIKDWISTLLNQPLVGKISMKSDGGYDFTGHNLKIVKKKDAYGYEYDVVEFDTSAFGSFTDVAVETIDDKEYIVATAEIWKRFSKACEVIMERIKAGTLHTSWEISVDDSVPTIVDGMVTKVINAGRFIGHCLLGEDVEPAYDSSGLLQIASSEYGSDIEIAESLIADMLADSNIKNNEREDTMAKAKVDETKKVDDVLEVSDSENEQNGNSVDTSQLTHDDIVRRIEAQLQRGYVYYIFPEENVCLVRHWGLDDLEYHKYTYTVEDDEVTISEPETIKLVFSVKDINSKVEEFEKQIAEKDELILRSSTEVQSLKSEISELSQYKDKFNEVEQARMTAELEAQKDELISLVVSSGLLTREEIEQSEELTGYVNELDKKSLMSEVGQRLADSLSNKVGTSEVSSEVAETPSVNLNNDDSGSDSLSIVKDFLKK